MSVPAWAVFISGAYGVRYERGGESNELQTRQPVGLLLGHRWSALSGLAEYSTFQERTGNSTLSVTRRQDMALLGVRYHAFDVANVFTWYPYFSGALGAYREEVSTELMGQSTEKVSPWKPVGGLGVGFFGKIYAGVRLGSEFRVLTATEFDPRALLDLSLRFGYEFE